MNMHRVFLVCLVDIKIKVDGAWHQLALNCPAGVDYQGTLVDVGRRLSEATAPGPDGPRVFIGRDAEMEVRFRWVEPPLAEMTEGANSGATEKMICTCGYQAQDITKAKKALGENHTQAEHTIYIFGRIDAVIEILDKHWLIPKETDSEDSRCISGGDTASRDAAG